LVAGHRVAGFQLAPVGTGRGGVQAFLPGFAGGLFALTVGFAVQAERSGQRLGYALFRGAVAGAEKG